VQTKLERDTLLIEQWDAGIEANVNEEMDHGVVIAETPRLVWRS
jgi:hypothetical protein